MTKIRKKIGNIPINTIKQDLQSTVNASVAQMQQDVTDFIDEETAQYPEIGGAFKFQENPEYISVETDSEDKLLAGRTTDGEGFENIGFSTPKLSVGGSIVRNDVDIESRLEVKTDVVGRVVAYRDKAGVLHEESGIVANNIELSDEGIVQLKSDIDRIPEKKKWQMPSYGKINLKEETFYLDAVSGFDSKNDVVCIQILDDTDLNAAKRLTISQYYLKASLIPLPDGSYDRTSITQSSIALELHAGKDVVAIDDKYFATAIYTPIQDGEYITSYAKNKATKVIDPGTGDIIGYEYNGNSTEVKQIKDVPPYNAWKVYKSIEHYCSADIDFGSYYSKENVPVSIKYQGDSTTALRKRGFRITFFKKNDFAKKDKIKIGEMIRLSGFNMKSYATDPTRIKDPFVSNVVLEMWESRGNSYPWNSDSIVFNGATGTIKSFPIETWFGNEFFGLQFFGYKKDERNYMLDGDDDTSGIFAQGTKVVNWNQPTSEAWNDEMGVDGRELAYPDNEDSLSVESAAALDELFKRTTALMTGTIEIEGETVDFTREMFEEYVDAASWIDYWIVCEVFQLWDNLANNIIIHSRRDKKKFYAFFYDLDQSLNFTYNKSLLDIQYHEFWETFRNEYKDSIINRYFELRKTVFSDSNLYSAYKSIVSDIPEEANSAEYSRWNMGDYHLFEGVLSKLYKRLEWLDDTYFNL